MAEMTKRVVTADSRVAQRGRPQVDELVQVDFQARFLTEFPKHAHSQRFGPLPVSSRQVVVPTRVPNQQGFRGRGSCSKDDNPSELRRKTRGSEAGESASVQHAPGFAAVGAPPAVRGVLRLPRTYLLEFVFRTSRGNTAAVPQPNLGSPFQMTPTAPGSNGGGTRKRKERK